MEHFTNLWVPAGLPNLHRPGCQNFFPSVLPFAGTVMLPAPGETPESREAPGATPSRLAFHHRPPECKKTTSFAAISMAAWGRQAGHWYSGTAWGKADAQAELVTGWLIGSYGVSEFLYMPKSPACERSLSAISAGQPTTTVAALRAFCPPREYWFTPFMACFNAGFLACHLGGIPFHFGTCQLSCRLALASF